MRSLDRARVRGGHKWSRGGWGWQVLCKSFFKVHYKIRNEEKKRENTVGQNEGEKKQEAEKKNKVRNK